MLQGPVAWALPPRLPWWPGRFLPTSRGGLGGFLPASRGGLGGFLPASCGGLGASSPPPMVLALLVCG